MSGLYTTPLLSTFGNLAELTAPSIQWISSEDELPPTDTRLHIKGYFGLKMWNEELAPSIGSWGRVEGEPYGYLQWQVEGHDTHYWAGGLTVTHWAYVEAL